MHDRELLIALANGTIATASLRSLMRPVGARSGEQARLRVAARDAARQVSRWRSCVDEYGGTAGLVTMEDLLEEIVGEIRDEHDEGEEEPIRRISDDEAVVEAGTNIEDVNAALGMDLPHEDFETIGGYTVGLFGRLPHEGEEIAAVEGVRLRVDRTRGRRILRGPRLHQRKGAARRRAQAPPPADDAISLSCLAAARAARERAYAPLFAVHRRCGGGDDRRPPLHRSQRRERLVRAHDLRRADGGLGGGAGRRARRSPRSR